MTEYLNIYQFFVFAWTQGVMFAALIHYSALFWNFRQYRIDKIG